MAFQRRSLLAAALGVTMVAVGASASAQSFPSKPIRIIVPFSPGGVTDLIARIVANGLQKRLGQPVTVENRTGGSAIPATNLVAKAAPDGYTLLLSVGQPFSTNVVYFKDELPYGANDYTAVALTSEVPMGIYVSADSPYKTLADLVNHAKANPGKLNYGAVASQISQGSLGMEAFKYAAGLDIVPIVYQGGAPTLVAMLSGQVQMILSDIASAAQHVHAGKVRVLAVVQDKRLQSLPDVPTMAEAGYGNADIPMVWNGVFAPPNTPKAVVEKLNAEINAVMQTPEALKFLKDSSLLPAVTTPERMASLMKREYETFAPIMKRLGLENKK